MEDSPSENSGLGSVLKESADYSIPKINMKFDGNTWKKNSEKENEQNKDGTMDVAPSADTNMQDSHQDAQPSTSSTTQSTSAAPSNPHQTSPASSLSTDDVDGEFEPSVDAMVHDFDDESTLEEEEDEDEEDSDELDDLTREGEMPLEELLAMYSAKPDPQPQEEEREESPAVEREAEERRENQDRIRKLRSNTTFLSPPHPHPDSDEDGECDGDYAPPPEDWKKPPRVGEDFQVDSIPDLKKQSADYDDETDKLVWDPEKVDMDKVEDYLSMVSQPITSDPSSFMIPMGGHLRDNEDALFLLTQCNNDTDEALRRFKWRPRSLANEMHVWSEDECRQFELGLSLYGKDFHAIHHNKVKTKAIGDIVKFYYIWKKTERYDNFNAKTRLGKKKDSLHPGVTDYMERLLDETEHSLSAGMGVSGSGGGPSATQGPLTHSAALQQHLIDLRVTRSHARHRPNNHYPDSPNTDYSEMNGLLDSDFADDPGMFANIQPMPHSAPNLGNISPSVPFSEPPINVGYSDPGNFAPVASTVVTCNNNNNTDDTARHFQAAEVDPSVSCPTSSERGFRPLDPAEITPALKSDQAAATVRRTTPLLQEVLSSIDELESTYPIQNTSTSRTSEGNPQGISSSPKLPHRPSSSDHLLPKRSRLSSPHPQEERSKEDTPAPSNIQRPSTTMTSSTTGGNSPDFGGRKSPASSSTGKIPDAHQLISC